MDQQDRMSGLVEGEGFGEFVAARGASLHRFAYLLTGSAHDAADLVQGALERAWPRWSQLTRTRTAEAYLRRSIVNASVSTWRKDRRLVSVGETEHVVRPGDHQRDHAAGVTDADHAWRLCSGLPPQQRAAVVLRFYEDLSFAEVAAVLT